MFKIQQRLPRRYILTVFIFLLWLQHCAVSNTFVHSGIILYFLTEILDVLQVNWQSGLGFFLYFFFF